MSRGAADSSSYMCARASGASIIHRHSAAMIRNARRWPAGYPGADHEPHTTKTDSNVSRDSPHPVRLRGWMPAPHDHHAATSARKKTRLRSCVETSSRTIPSAPVRGHKPVPECRTHGLNRDHEGQFFEHQPSLPMAKQMPARQDESVDRAMMDNSTVTETITPPAEPGSLPAKLPHAPRRQSH